MNIDRLIEQAVNEWTAGVIADEQLVDRIDDARRPWLEPGDVPTAAGWYEVWRPLAGITPAQLTPAGQWFWWGRAGAVGTTWVMGSAKNEGWRFRPWWPTWPEGTT